MTTYSNKLNWILAFLIIGVFASCKKGFPAEKLLGTWNVAQANRDSKDITLMMQETYFTFMEGNQLQSNFPLDIPIDKEIGYTLQEKKIINIEGAGDLSFDITELTDTSLTLLTSLRGSNIEMKFRPKE